MGEPAISTYRFLFSAASAFLSLCASSALILLVWHLETAQVGDHDLVNESKTIALALSTLLAVIAAMLAGISILTARAPVDGDLPQQNKPDKILADWIEQSKLESAATLIIASDSGLAKSFFSARVIERKQVKTSALTKFQKYVETDRSMPLSDQTHVRHVLAGTLADDELLTLEQTADVLAAKEGSRDAKDVLRRLRSATEELRLLTQIADLA